MDLAGLYEFAEELRKQGRHEPVRRVQAAPAFDIDTLIDDPDTKIIVCCGSGGVGKTTTAAARRRTRGRARP